ncbi:MAG: hypothetical protein ACQEW8_10785 [Actinomycetota bacterium]
MKLPLWRAWWISAAAVAAVMLIGGALAGPFGAAIMALGALILLAPLAVIVGALSLAARGQRATLAVALLVLVLGWLTALAAAAGLGAGIAGIPANAQSVLPPFFTWLTLLAPFAGFGVGVAVVVYTVRWRRRRKGQRDG